MKKGLIKAAVLMAVFLITLLISGKVTNKDQLDLTTEMEAPTLPVIVLYNEDRQINELYGYTSQMNATGMRDTLSILRGLPKTAHRCFGFLLPEEAAQDWN